MSQLEIEAKITGHKFEKISRHGSLKRGEGLRLNKFNCLLEIPLELISEATGNCSPPAWVESAEFIEKPISKRGCVLAVRAIARPRAEKENGSHVFHLRGNPSANCVVIYSESTQNIIAL
jgi:hypothetical protein